MGGKIPKMMRAQAEAVLGHECEHTPKWPSVRKDYCRKCSAAARARLGYVARREAAMRGEPYDPNSWMEQS